MGVSPEHCVKPSRVASVSPSPRRNSGRSEARVPERWSGVAQGRADVDGEPTRETIEAQQEAQDAESVGQTRSQPDTPAATGAMDASDEKAAGAGELQRTAMTTPDVYVDAPSYSDADTIDPDTAGTEDPEKDAIRRDLQNKPDIEDPEKDAVRRDLQNQANIEDPEKDAIRRDLQNKHLTYASNADDRKRESIETPPRWSTVLSDSDAGSEHTIQCTPVAEHDGIPPATRSRVTLQVPEGEHEGGDHHPTRPTPFRGLSAGATTVVSSKRSLPSLRRRETKLMQKEAHPWQHLGKELLHLFVRPHVQH